MFVWRFLLFSFKFFEMFVKVFEFSIQIQRKAKKRDEKSTKKTPPVRCASARAERRGGGLYVAPAC
jgi:hypothetical protein